METKNPPHSLEAEMSLLGALLVGDDQVWGEIHGYLTPEDFYKAD